LWAFRFFQWRVLITFAFFAGCLLDWLNCLYLFLVLFFLVLLAILKCIKTNLISRLVEIVKHRILICPGQVLTELEQLWSWNIGIEILNKSWLSLRMALFESNWSDLFFYKFFTSFSLGNYLYTFIGYNWIITKVKNDSVCLL